MTRPGFVLDVDERTPPLLVHEGEGLRLESFPLGTRVVYPPESLPGLRDVDAAIAAALEHPHNSEPLRALLRPGMRLTIAFDDMSIPLPPMRPPDIRGRIIEQVLTLAAAAGVDDVELIAANALHRRMTGAEIRRIVGERVFRSFWPDALSNHDAEDADNLLHVGVTDMGEDVEINRRAAESDLLVYVNVNLVAMDGGHKSVPVGLASYNSLRHHHNSTTMVHSRSFMDPEHSALHSSAWRMGRLLARHLKIFPIETTLNNQTFPASMPFLIKREWEWSVRDQAMAYATRARAAAAAGAGPPQGVPRLVADYGLTGVHAGEIEAVHEQTLAAVHRQQLVEVHGQTDVLVLGLPYLCPYNVNSVMNPILAMCLGLGYFFNMYRGQPLVRRGGALILYHPVPWEFTQLHHPSYVDFFEEVLAESRPTRRRSRRSSRSSTPPTRGTSTSTGPRTPTTACTRSTCGTGGRTRSTTSSEVVWVGGDRRAVRPDGLPGRVDAARRARDGLRHRRVVPVDHLPARAAARHRGRAVSARSRVSLREVARGWRWGARPPLPAAVAAEAPIPARARVPDRMGALTGRRWQPARSSRAAGSSRWSGRRWRRRSAGWTCWTGWTGRCSSSPTTPRIWTPRSFCARCPRPGGRGPRSPPPPTTSSTAGCEPFPPRSCSPPSRSTARAGPRLRPRASCSREHWNLVVFPEGTRSSDGQMGRFRLGAAQLATAFDVPIVPVGIRGGFAAMPRGRSWPAPGRRTVSVRFGPPMRAGPGEDVRALTARLAREVTRIRARGRDDVVGVTAAVAAGATRTGRTVGTGRAGCALAAGVASVRARREPPAPVPLGLSRPADGRRSAGGTGGLCGALLEPVLRVAGRGRRAVRSRLGRSAPLGDVGVSDRQRQRERPHPYPGAPAPASSAGTPGARRAALSGSGSSSAPNATWRRPAAGLPAASGCLPTPAPNAPRRGCCSHRSPSGTCSPATPRRRPTCSVGPPRSVTASTTRTCGCWPGWVAVRRCCVWAARPRA